MRTGFSASAKKTGPGRKHSFSSEGIYFSYAFLQSRKTVKKKVEKIEGSQIR
jgi:hypothetical protein